MSRDDPYLYPNSLALKNRLGIRDEDVLEKIETQFVLLSLDNLTKNPVPGNLDVEHLKDIHRGLFEDVYFTKGEAEPAFAGEIREIDISKYGDEVNYPSVNHPVEPLSVRLDNAFADLKTDLDRIEPAEMKDRLATHLAEIWECHPFRDGNTRTNMAFAATAAKELGLEFNIDKVNVREYRNKIREHVRTAGKDKAFTELMYDNLSLPGHSQTRSKDEALSVVEAKRRLNKEARAVYARTHIKHGQELESQVADAKATFDELAVLKEKGPASAKKEDIESFLSREAHLSNLLQRKTRDIQRSHTRFKDASSERKSVAWRVVHNKLAQESKLVKSSDERDAAMSLLNRWRAIENSLIHNEGK